MLTEWFEKKREKARKRYEGADMPALKYGLTIRLNARGLTLDDRKQAHSEQRITIEHENCEVHNLFEQLDNPLVKEHLLSTDPADRTRFDDFTEAFFDIGLLIIVPPSKRATVDLTRTITSDTFKAHTLIICQPNSQLTVIDKYHGDAQVNAQNIEIICMEGAHARYASVQALPETSFDLSSYRAKCVGNASRVDWFIASLGSSLTHANVDSSLEGEGTIARSYGVFLGRNDQQFDVSASTFHRASHSTSDMYTRGVLNGKSKAVYRGNIDIASHAFGCNGYQKEETILVSPDAIADAIPNLEIRNNDVKCSHGATIGRVDDEQLFYLTSRGISEPDAIRMIVEGFFEPLTTRMEWPELFTIIQPLVEERL